MLPDTMSQSAPRARPAAKGNRANEKWAGKKRHYENSKNTDFVGDTYAMHSAALEFDKRFKFRVSINPCTN